MIICTSLIWVVGIYGLPPEILIIAMILWIPDVVFMCIIGDLIKTKLDGYKYNK